MEENYKVKVSAIITTRNRLSLLKRAIDSVFKQTYKSIELIVVDDASTDGTKEYCQCGNFTYIYIPHEESKGGNYARNLGIKASKGKYVAFLDDDDYWLPNKIEKQVSLIESKSCELVYCGKILEIIKGDKIKYINTLPNPHCDGDLSKKILLTICITTSNILAKKQALLEINLFDEKLQFWQEYELTIRMAQRKPIYFVNEPLSIYRIDKNDKQRLTNKYYKWREAVSYIHLKHANLYKQLNLMEKFQVKLLVMGDAAIRCKSSGLRSKYYTTYFFWHVCSLGFKLINKIKKAI